MQLAKSEVTADLPDEWQRIQGNAAPEEEDDVRAVILDLLRSTELPFQSEKKKNLNA